MAHLSSQLSHLNLLHDTYESHLDNNGKTIESELEVKKFASVVNLLLRYDQKWL